GRNKGVRARAGTGKTTVIVEGVKRAPDRTIQVCAFNRTIEKELSLRLAGSNARTKTLHGLGYGIVMSNWNGIQVLDMRRLSDRETSITEAVTGGRVPDAAKKLISKLHSKGREIHPHATKVGDLTNLMYDFDILPDDYLEEMGYEPSVIEEYALKAMDFAASKKPEDGIDFSDMIFLPCRNRWIRPRHDLVVVDEAQDMSPAQLEIALGLSKQRICVVGDDRQAIYGFRGIDSNTFNTLIKTINADVSPLTVTYRCPQSVVRMAQMLVPDFQAAESNQEGIIRNLNRDKLVDEAQENDFILSRLNAPLVSVAISLLKNGKRARVAGRDIGAGLKALIRKFRARSIPDFLMKLDKWEQKMTHRMEKAGREDKIAEIRDKADMLRTLFEEAPSMEFVEQRIDALFSDTDGRGVIMCSSVHKAKGLETQRVFTLEETFKPRFGPGGIEEENIRYVAITRAQAELVLVSEPPPQ
ncbi:MAG TPA: UvrD-helicase domain-containing protein, partial [Terriglobia bacterium]|nr:UvrD-helicase domain-containing protein [Terriglobia bacterium]